MQSETLAEALADLYDVVRPNSAASAHFRASVERERADALNEAAWEFVHEQCDDVPEMNANAKHDEDCWKRHARCLADRILYSS